MKNEGLKPISGEVYRGKLNEAEDNMNCQMSDVTVTLRDGRTHTLDNVFIRGSQIRFLILPDMLKNAPMFKVFHSILKMLRNPKLSRTSDEPSAVAKAWALVVLELVVRRVDEALHSVGDRVAADVDVVECRAEEECHTGAKPIEEVRSLAN